MYFKNGYDLYLHVTYFFQGQLSKERSSRSQASSLTAELETRLSTLHLELEHSREKEEKATLDNRQLTERVSALEKEATSLALELKAAQARYNQEVVAHQETERSRILSKEEANLEVVKGNCRNFCIKIETFVVLMKVYFTLFTRHRTKERNFRR